MKKSTLALLVASLLTLTLLVGCGGEPAKATTDKTAPIKIGVTAGPHAEILEQVKALAAKQNLKIEVVEFTDFVTPNVALFQEELFANSMQHRPYLNATNKKDPKFDLVDCFKTVTFPMAGYSQKIKKGEALPDGATVAIPNDPSNGGRALLLLAQQGLITVKDPKNVTTAVADITANPHNYK
ncbi:MAG: MetQ/NlpA family ABC transporter substrate-binding protein, partial [Acidaminococcaceae bacterium]